MNPEVHNHLLEGDIMRTAVVILSVLVFSALGFSRTHYVPIEKPTIQLVIDWDAHGDTIIVAPGTYYEGPIQYSMD